MLLPPGGPLAEVTVRESDPSDVVAAQWQALTDVLDRPRTALIYHLENHYCLVFAAREWRAHGSGGGGDPEGAGGVGTEGPVVRQVLVAKPGQKPNAWVSFEALRQTLWNWSGHALVGVRATD